MEVVTFLISLISDKNFCNAQFTILFYSWILIEKCGRRIVDNIFDKSDISKLFEIVQKGMSQRGKNNPDTFYTDDGKIT